MDCLLPIKNRDQLSLSAFLHQHPVTFIVGFNVCSSCAEAFIVQDAAVCLYEHCSRQLLLYWKFTTIAEKWRCSICLLQPKAKTREMPHGSTFGTRRLKQTYFQMQTWSLSVTHSPGCFACSICYYCIISHWFSSIFLFPCLYCDYLLILLILILMQQRSILLASELKNMRDEHTCLHNEEYVCGLVITIRHGVPDTTQTWLTNGWTRTEGCGYNLETLSRPGR